MPPEITDKTLRQVLEQMVGITVALSIIHNVEWEKGSSGHMRHGDIKPSNILAFSNEPKVCPMLKLSDFGLTKHYDDRTLSRDAATDDIGEPQLCFPPEREHIREPRSRRWDIWSLGLVLLQFIYYLLHDSQQCEQHMRNLAKLRYSYQGDRLIPSLREDLDHLKKQHAAHAWVRDLVDLIEHRLLVPVGQRSYVDDVIDRLKAIQASMNAKSTKGFRRVHCAGALRDLVAEPVQQQQQARNEVCGSDLDYLIDIFRNLLSLTLPVPNAPNINTS